MKLFGRRSSVSASGADLILIRDRCWADPQLDQLHAAVSDPAHPGAHRVDWALQHLATVRHDPERQVMAVSAVADQLTGCLDDVRAAAAAPGLDRNARADAVALLAHALVKAAWDVRGGGRAETVGEESFATFHRILDEADEVGYQALELDPAHSAAGVARLTSARGLGVSGEEFWARFETATRARPTLYAAHTSMLQALCKKWYGSHELMFEFARKVAAEAPIGDPVGAVLALAHTEYMLDQGRASIPDTDLDLLRYAADRWVAGGAAALTLHPSAPAAHQLFGWALRADPQRLRLHLSHSMGRIAFYPWEYLEDGERLYRKWYAESGVRV